ncbi:hypothetical protein TPAR_01439 [Tolypocladium paradoxum]|uniref:Uncharacterized protein n=1 Tax=Tolypocladium paradoxum TaxID=94208 RepID=A0A2S4L7E0_9HYPO|nr:hypothetical protein TPAR_01439 [Tolypocladium paradoxum]
MSYQTSLYYEKTLSKVPSMQPGKSTVRVSSISTVDRKTSRLCTLRFRIGLRRQPRREWMRTGLNQLRTSGQSSGDWTSHDQGGAQDNRT